MFRERTTGRSLDRTITDCEVCLKASEAMWPTGLISCKERRVVPGVDNQLGSSISATTDLLLQSGCCHTDCLQVPEKMSIDHTGTTGIDTERSSARKPPKALHHRAASKCKSP